jgi:hypothetical protein
MKKIYLSIIALAFGTSSFAQLDFEQAAAWDAFPVASVAGYEYPADWFGTTLKETPGANSTATALRLETENDPTLAALFASALQWPITNNNVLGYGVYEQAMTGASVFPVSVDFYYQFSPVNNDTAGIVLVEVVDTMMAGTADDVTLAQGIGVYTSAQASWMMTSVPLTYFGGGTPTGMTITAVSSPKDFFTTFPVALPDPEDGTYLLVDEFVLTGNMASVDEINTESYEVNAYPNPASDNFRVELPDSRTNTISIMALTGQVVKTINVTNLNVNINVSDLDNGVYMYQLKDGNGKVLTTRKLVVKK